MKQETMTPNPKHLEILGEVTGLEIGALKYLSFLDTTIAAMQILQNRIDDLEKENERLKDQVKRSQLHISSLRGDNRLDEIEGKDY